MKLQFYSIKKTKPVTGNHCSLTRITRINDEFTAKLKNLRTFGAN